jgi:hypothetical protein
MLVCALRCWKMSPCWDNLDAILSVPGIDLYSIGPKRFCPKSWLSRPARPSGSCQDNAGNHTSHPPGWAHDATGRDARGVGQRYAARRGSLYSTILESVNAAVRSGIAYKRAGTDMRKPTRPTMLWRGCAFSANGAVPTIWLLTSTPSIPIFLAGTARPRPRVLV